MQQHGVTERLGRRRENNEPGLVWEPRDALDEALFDLARDGPAARDPQATGKIDDVPCSRQLEQCERVTATLGNDLVADAGVERTVHVVEQQCARVALAETDYL